MASIERDLRAELKRLPELARTSALATLALELARRIDAGPGDDATVRLARELRQELIALHGMTTDGPDDVERFLERIAAPHLGHAAN